MPKMGEVKQNIKRALERAELEITSGPDTFYGKALSGEGYTGGYRDALNDVLTFMNGWIPSNSRYWPKFIKETK